MKIGVWILTFFLFLNFLLLPPAQSAVTGQEIQLWVDKKEALVEGRVKVLDEAPKLIGGRLFVSLATISDLLGLEINWINSEQKVEIKKDALSISLWVGKQVAYVNGEEVPLDAAPIIQEGITLILLKFITDKLGLETVWDNTERKVTIYSDNSRHTWECSYPLMEEALSQGKAFRSSQEFLRWQEKNYQVCLGAHDSVLIMTPFATLTSLSFFSSQAGKDLKTEDVNFLMIDMNLNFCARVHGNNPDFYKKYSAKVRLSDGREVSPVVSHFSETGKKLPFMLFGPKFVAFCNWGFPLSRIPPSGMITFVISDPERGEESVSINLGNFK
ncbi:MAG: copper amine oxidase N-terminal domain-containing protein [Coprothermobacterota bacterium]|nr:copper amine oxidase N-terminal domain-containing protein [Coprothermobacterota bacterium]